MAVANYPHQEHSRPSGVACADHNCVVQIAACIDVGGPAHNVVMTLVVIAAMAAESAETAVPADRVGTPEQLAAAQRRSIELAVAHRPDLIRLVFESTATTVCEAAP